MLPERQQQPRLETLALFPFPSSPFMDSFRSNSLYPGTEGRSRWGPDDAPWLLQLQSVARHMDSSFLRGGHRIPSSVSFSFFSPSRPTRLSHTCSLHTHVHLNLTPFFKKRGWLSHLICHVSIPLRLVHTHTSAYTSTQPKNKGENKQNERLGRWLSACHISWTT